MSGDEESQLSQLLEGAKNASPMTRIEFRDAIAEQGGIAIPALASWLRDPRLAAFSVRVLQRIAANFEEPASTRLAVAAALEEAESEAPTAAVRADIEAALVGLIGHSRKDGSRRRAGPAAGKVPIDRLGVLGRHYWAMRTSADHAGYIWSEAQLGRLRQGWGWEPEQDLRGVMALVAADRDITDVQRMALGARRMLDAEPDGMSEGDLIVAQNLPAYGRFSVFRVTGSYRFELPAPPDRQDFGHIIPVELVTANVDRHDVCVSEALRRAISLQPRLYEITRYGGDVEALIEGSRGATAGISQEDEHPRPEPTDAAELEEAAEVPLTAAVQITAEPGQSRPVTDLAEQLLDQILESIGRRAREIEPEPVLVHWPHVGSNYRGTVIVGQAVYGWPDDFRASDFDAPEGRAGAIAAARARNAERADPMSWIAEVPPKVFNSPFWTCSRQAVEALEPDSSTPWYSRFCWMNLYPCAPSRGNPEGALREAEAPFVGELLRAHIERLDAKRIICFVGPYWWSAANGAGLADLPEAPSPLYRAGPDGDGRLWIVGMHPNGASHRGCSARNYAELISRQFSDLVEGE